jgi:linoleate 10R-lipoxygenase
VAADARIEQGAGLPPVDVKEGDLIWASFTNAHLNPDDFPDPKSVNPSRPPDSYNVNGSGFHKCPGANLAQLMIVELIKIVFKLKNVRRAPGDAGKMPGFTEVTHDTASDWYIQRNGTAALWAGSLVIAYDP